MLSVYFRFVGPTDLSMKSLASNSSTSSNNSLGRSGGGTSAQLSHTEVTAVRQLIAGYRESAAFLLRSADELENLIIQQNWAVHSPSLLIATIHLSQPAFILNSRSITSGLYLLALLFMRRRVHSYRRTYVKLSGEMTKHRSVRCQRNEERGLAKMGACCSAALKRDKHCSVGVWPCESYTSPPPCP